MTLNQDQEKAAQAFFQFLFSEEKEFSISGPAGTGKTFLMDHLINTTMKEYQDAAKLLGLPDNRWEVALTATTNKAAEVLSKATSRNASTIHSFLGLKVKDNYKTGVSDVVKTDQWTVHGRKLIFVDEASMIDSKLYRLILEGTDKTCKIVYLGDHCQMAPVFEKISPIYSQPKFIVGLTQPMRNAGQPALVSLCSQLRNTVETLAFDQIAPVPGVVDYLDANQAEQFLNSTFVSETPNCRVLCYTNERVQSYNQYIRNLRGHSEKLSKGERVICNSAIVIGSGILRAEQEFTVLEASTLIEDDVIDPKDPGAVLQTYKVDLLPVGSTKSLLLRVPVNPDHYKQLMQFYARQKRWEKFYHLNSYPDLRPKDAATVYKAQGSTYHTVFLDLANIGSCTQAEQLARMLYVGASRATDRLVLFGDLPARLFQKAA